MAARRPLVNVAGQIQELPSGDTLPFDAAFGRNLAIGDQGYELGVYGDKLSSFPRVLADTNTAFASGSRAWTVLLGRLAKGESITGFRLRVLTAMVGSTSPLANLFYATSLSSTAWTPASGSNVAVTLTSTGQVNTALALTASDDVWIRLVIVLTGTAPSTYPAWLTKGKLAGIADTTSGGHPIGGFSNSTSAPGATHDPSTGYTASTTLPWVTLY